VVLFACCYSADDLDAIDLDAIDLKNCTNVQGIDLNHMDYSYWNSVLKNSVNVNGSMEGIQINTVNYGKVANDYNFFYFLCQLKNSNTQNFTEEQYYAFWINAYNAIAVYTIVSNACETDLFGDCKTLVSIKDVGVSSSPIVLDPPVWKDRFFFIDNKMMSLNDVENDKLRQDISNPPYPHKRLELHTAIVCASISCPNLRNEAYTPQNLQAQLEDNAREFLTNRKKGAKLEGGYLFLSSIFLWFQKDFNGGTQPTGNFPNLANFLLKYTNNSQSMDIYNFVNQHQGDVNSESTNVVKFFDYNWKVNGDLNSLCSASRLCYSYVHLIITLSVVIIIAVLVIIIVQIRRKKTSSYDEVH